MSLPTPASQSIGVKITVRDAIIHLHKACPNGVTEFFRSIMPQQEGQHPLDRELFLTNDNMRYTGWIVHHVTSGQESNHAEKLRSHYVWERDCQLDNPIELSNSDPLYELQQYFVCGVGNVVQPETVDYKYAKNFMAYNDTPDLFIQQFLKVEFMGVKLQLPARGSAIDYSDESDWGRFVLGGAYVRFSEPNNYVKSALFECDGKRHNVAKFYAELFFKERAKIEDRLATIKQLS